MKLINYTKKMIHIVVGMTHNKEPTLSVDVDINESIHIPDEDVISIQSP